MGSAALELAYVASGRLDAYVERTINLWDIAAGGLMVESSGGEFYTLPAPGGNTVARCAPTTACCGENFRSAVC